jgi:hypothetical protein
MRETWRGMIIGAFTGAGVGMLLDSRKWAAATGATAGAALAAHARTAADSARHQLHDADLPSKLSDAKDTAAKALADSDVPSKVAEAKDQAAKALKDADIPSKAADARKAAKGAADKVGDAAQDAASRARR